jgi:hypothetical protein
MTGNGLTHVRRRTAEVPQEKGTPYADRYVEFVD